MSAQIIRWIDGVCLAFLVGWNVWLIAHGIRTANDIQLACGVGDFAFIFRAWPWKGGRP